ncbi:unnamed protein product [Owenia fusiformis]|uniref:L-Fucosyltransferase n=1 Tax=Owenia fusiformis TaxID=6347 RepID=A0A8S4MZ48_OWEFU|nr:unnamed protein product [Owenia fusiformis]
MIMMDRMRKTTLSAMLLTLQLLLGLCGVYLVVMIWFTSNYKTNTLIPTEHHGYRREVSRTSFFSGIFFDTYKKTEKNHVGSIAPSIFDEHHPVPQNVTSNVTSKIDQRTIMENKTVEVNPIKIKNVPKKRIWRKPQVKKTVQKPPAKKQIKVDIPRPDDKPRRLYLEHGLGRLGNKLFQFAAAFSIAIANNMTLYVPYDTEVIRIFNISHIKTYTAQDYISFRASGAKIQTIKHISYDHSFMNLKWKYHIKLHKGGVQTYMYFWKEYQSHIRSLYVFNKFIKSQINAYLDGLQKKYSMHGEITYVGIHCRRGDRAYDPAVINAGYKATPVSYFQKAINLTLTRYKTPIVYVVATDDRDWTTKNFNPPGENTFFEHTPWGLTAEYDMGILSSMNHTIMSTGSFGWWSAYLAGGDVIYFNEPFKPKTVRWKLWKKYFETQMYPKEENWHGMGE